MCGRFTLFANRSTVASFVQAPEPEFDWEPRYNIAPTQPILACRQAPDRPGRELVRLRWGLIPSWATDISAGVKAINAKAETIAEKPFFRTAFKRCRCLIPGSGFYEWRKGSKGKQPYFIQPAQGELFAFAGLWETWAKAGESVQSCTIITTAANETMRPLHERMPAILPVDQFEAWLDSAATEAELLELLRPCPDEWLALHPVGLAVGNVRNQGAELVEPAAELFLA